MHGGVVQPTANQEQAGDTKPTTASGLQPPSPTCAPSLATPGENSDIKMLDAFCVLSRSGVVLFSVKFVAKLNGDPINALIQRVLLEERTSESTFLDGNYAVKWTMANDAGLVFIAVYQKMLPLKYVEPLLELVKPAFIAKVEAVSSASSPSSSPSGSTKTTSVDFASDFKRLHAKAEADTKMRKAARMDKGGGYQATVKKQQSFSGGAQDSPDGGDGDAGASGSDGDDGQAPASSIEENLKKMSLRGRGRGRGGRGKGGGSSRSIKEGGGAADRKPKKKEARTWDADQQKYSKAAERELDQSAGVGGGDDDTDKAGGALLEEQRRQLVGDVSNYDVDRDWVSDDDDGSFDDDDYVDVGGEDGIVGGGGVGSRSVGKNGKGGVFSFFKSLAGNKELTRDELAPVLDKFRSHLMEKNVASNIAEKCCESVCESLVGTENPTFTSVQSTVKDAMEKALVRILTPKRSFDILGDVMGSKRRGKPYVITFMGVNGVGKSTSLSKVCFWLLQNKMKVLIAACDTFRSGAVEQLRVHARCLGVEVFEQGYDKDASRVAGNAIKYAEENGIDVVLVDTAGRMQNNDRLMYSLVNLVTANDPDLVLFVGEALVGNDGVDQLTEFNNSLKKHQHNLSNPRVIDGIFLTKFDTIDDKVGAALSMVYSTGQPVVFVGVGQTYTDLKRLNVTSVVRSLLK